MDQAAHISCRKTAERAKFENSTAPETIGPDLTPSFRSQSHPEESEIGAEPVEPDWTR